MTHEPRIPDVDDVRRWLGEIPELCALLPDAAVARAAVESPRPAPAPRPPVKLDVLDLLDCRAKEHFADGSAAWVDPDRMGVLPYLDTWCRDLEAAAFDGDPIFGIPPRTDQPPDVPERPTVAALCDWLDREVDWASTLPQWFELADGIRVLRSRLRAATQAVRDHEARAVPCSRCGGDLDRVPGDKPLWECRDCWHQVTVQAVTLRQAAPLVGVHLRTLQRWALRSGILTPIGDGPRSRLFDLGQIRARAAEQRLRGA